MWPVCLNYPDATPQAQSIDDLMQRAREAITVCLEIQMDDAEKPLHFIGFQRIAV